MKKICKGCGRNRKIGKYSKDLYRKDGKRIYCRDCISIINKRYRLSPIGRIKHKKSVDTWKKNNKLSIKGYNRKYYRRKKHIILYNKRAREETESILIVDNFDVRPFYLPKTKKKEIKLIEINPKRKFTMN